MQPSATAGRRRSAASAEALLRERFAELGAGGRTFLDGLLRTQRYGKHQAAAVLALLATYARADVLAALERAVRYGAYSLAAVERILAGPGPAEERAGDSGRDDERRRLATLA